MKGAKRVAILLGVVGGLAVLGYAVVWMFRGPAASTAVVGNANVIGGLAGLLALVAVVVPWLRAAAQRRASAATPATALQAEDRALSGAAARLAVKVQKRVGSSPLRARLRRPMPLRVRFCSAKDVGASRAAVFGVRDAQRRDSPLVGHVDEVASCLHKLPLRQLVVVGEPGAGKSVLAMMLVEQLLETWQAGEPVPVLLGVSSWNPTVESVEQLVSRRLVEDFELPEPVAHRLASEPRCV